MVIRNIGASYLSQVPVLQKQCSSYWNPEIPASADLAQKGENVMRLAVTYENENVGQHFGRTEQFKVYDIKNGEIKSSKVIDTNGKGHGEGHGCH